MRREFNWVQWYTPRTRIICHIIFWMLITALYYFNYSRISKNSAWLFVGKELFITGTLYYSASWIIKSWGISKKIYLLLFFVMGAYIWWLSGTYLLCYAVRGYFGETDERFNLYIEFVTSGGFVGLFTFKKSAAMIMDFIYMVTIPLAPKLTKSLMESSVRMVQLERDNLSMELNFLKSQISPHFLFNILNSLYRMAEIKSPKTPDTILELANLMRYVLYEAKDSKIMLVKEIDFINSYINLAKLRYGDKVTILGDIQIPEEPYKIFPLILIPFIENAFKHGPERSLDNAYVEIALSIREDRLIMEVANSVKVGLQQSPYGGVGMTNVKRRLNLYYLDNHTLEIKNKEDRYKVCLTVNLK